MKLYQTILAVVALFGCLLLPTRVQGQAGSAFTPQEDAPARLLRFYYISYASTEAESAPARADFDLQSAETQHSFSLGANSFSPQLSYRGPLPVTLFKEAVGPQGEPIRIPLANLDFPSSWKGVLFLAFYDPAQAATGLAFRFFPVEYWAESIRAGNVRFINLTGQPLAVQLGKERGAVATGGALLLGLPTVATPLTFRVAEKTPDDRWKMHVSSVIPPFAANRGLVIFYPASVDGRGVRVLTVPELPQ